MPDGTNKEATESAVPVADADIYEEGAAVDEVDGNTDMWDCDLDGYVEPEIVADGVYKVAIRSCEKKVIDFVDKKTQAEVSAPVFNMFISIEDSTYDNHQGIFHTLWIPRADMGSKQLNFAKGDIITLKKLIGHTNPEGSGLDRTQVQGAVLYASVGQKEYKGRIQNMIKRFVPTPATG